MEARGQFKRFADGPPSILEDRSRARINTVIAGVIIFFIQIAVGLLYGLLMFPKSTGTPTLLNYYQTAIAVFVTVGGALFIVVGFGSIMSYLRGLAWSGIGFTLLIFALSIEMFFLVNALWGWAGIQIAVDKPAFRKNIKQYNMVLTLGVSGFNIAGNTITQAFKCALANVVAFSAIIGRGGPLEAVIISFIGSIGYQLLRVVMTNYTFDGPGTFTVFIYGGFLGLITSLFLRCRQSCIENGSTADHPLYTSTQANSTLALVGTVFIWVFFPVFSYDAIWLGGTFTYYTAVFSMYYSLCAATIASFVWSSVINGHLVVRDIIFGPVAGGIIAGTASLYVVNPVYAMVMGFTGGSVQVIGQNLIEKYWARNKYQIVNSTSFILFGVIGLLGSAFASGWNAIIWTDNEGFAYINDNVFPQGRRESHWPILMGLMSVAWGIATGIFTGILMLATASHTQQNHFNDFTYWKQDDGIRYDVSVIQEPKPTPIVEPQDVQGKWVSGSNLVKSQHAYL